MATRNSGGMGASPGSVGSIWMEEAENFCALLESPERGCPMTAPTIKRRAQARTMGKTAEAAVRVLCCNVLSFYLLGGGGSASGRLAFAPIATSCFLNAAALP